MDLIYSGEGIGHSLAMLDRDFELNKSLNNLLINQWTYGGQCINHTKSEHKIRD